MQKRDFIKETIVLLSEASDQISKIYGEFQTGQLDKENFEMQYKDILSKVREESDDEYHTPNNGCSYLHEDESNLIQSVDDLHMKVMNNEVVSDTIFLHNGNKMKFIYDAYTYLCSEYRAESVNEGFCNVDNMTGNGMFEKIN